MLLDIGKQVNQKVSQLLGDFLIFYKKYYIIYIENKEKRKGWYFYMKYFIDFEATQFSEEIISIGCIREDGETFYSLVAPVDGKITPFITNLTGITAEMLKTAMSPDHVFEMFYDWAFIADDTPDFFVWGNSDVDFLRHTFKRTTSRKARMAIGYMCGSATDYAKKFCKTIKADSCALIKAFNTLVDEEASQTHNALDDAVMLFQVYDIATNIPVSELKEKMSTVVTIKKTGTAAQEKIIKWNEMGLDKGTICIINKKGKALQIFKDIEEAADWILNTKISEEQREKTNRNNIKKKIKSAYSGGQYYSMAWRIVA